MLTRENSHHSNHNSKTHKEFFNSIAEINTCKLCRGVRKYSVLSVVEGISNNGFLYIEFWFPIVYANGTVMSSFVREGNHCTNIGKEAIIMLLGTAVKDYNVDILNILC